MGQKLNLANTDHMRGSGVGSIFPDLIYASTMSLGNRYIGQA